MSEIAILKNTLGGHTDIINSVAFHPTELLLATGSLDKTAKLWQISANGSAANCVSTLKGSKGHSRGVNSVAFHPTAPLLATGSSDKTAKLWRFSTDGSAANNMQATCVDNLRGHNYSVNSVAFHPTAPLLATGSGDSTTKLWELNIQNLLIVSSQPPLSVAASANNSGLTINYVNGVTIITVDAKLLEPKANPSNKSCPSFMPLYEKIMAINLDGHFIFNFKEQPGIDAGGLKRSIFDKVLPVYTHKFFDSIEKNNEFIILKEISKTFIDETNQLLTLAIAANTKIFLRIDPTLLDLLLSSDLKKYFSNNKKNKFKKDQ